MGSIKVLKLGGEVNKRSFRNQVVATLMLLQ